MGFSIHSLKLTYGWLEDDPFLWEGPIFSFRDFFFSLSEKTWKDSEPPRNPQAAKPAGGSQRAFKVTEDLDNPELAFWGGVATGTIFVSLLICLKHLGDHMQFFFGNAGKRKELWGSFGGWRGH